MRTWRALSSGPMPWSSVPALLLMTVRSRDAAAVQRRQQVLGHADDAEAADHDRRAVGNGGDGGVGAGDDLVHAVNYSGVVRRWRARAAASKRALDPLTVVEGGGGVA